MSSTVARLAVGERESNVSVLSKEERVVASIKVGSHTLMWPAVTEYLSYYTNVKRYLKGSVLYHDAVFLPIQIITRFQFTSRPSILIVNEQFRSRSKHWSTISIADA